MGTRVWFGNYFLSSSIHHFFYLVISSKTQLAWMRTVSQVLQPNFTISWTLFIQNRHNTNRTSSSLAIHIKHFLPYVYLPYFKLNNYTLIHSFTQSFWFCSIQSPDDRVADWPLMWGYTPTMVITATYLLAVYVGPKIMENRKPFDLRVAIIIYNFLCVIMNFHICSEVGAHPST